MLAAAASLAVAGVLAGCDEPSFATKKFSAPTAVSAPPEPVQYGVSPAQAPAEAKRVMVVVNTASSDSKQIGAYYAKRRQIPSTNIVSIAVSTSEQTTTAEFQSRILEPVRKAISLSKNRIDYIVMTKGTPMRLDDLNGYSVDSLLAGMNLKFEPIPKTLGANAGREIENLITRSRNPFFNATERFNSKKFNMYLVTRLEGYTVDQCKRLVDLSLGAKPAKGPFFFDEAGNRRSGGYEGMQQTLAMAHNLLTQKRFQSTIDTTDEFVAPPKPVMGYASWGSNDGKFDGARYRSIKFLPGALAETFVSTSGRTFVPTAGGQSLIADLIASGITGVKGYVSEPYTFALANPAIMFDHYTAGFNLAESIYSASVVIKWKDIVIGDPLCNPYARGPK